MGTPKEKYKEVRFPYIKESGKRVVSLIGGEIQGDFIKEGERVLLIKMPSKEKTPAPPEKPTLFQHKIEDAPVVTEFIYPKEEEIEHDYVKLEEEVQAVMENAKAGKGL